MNGFTRLDVVLIPPADIVHRAIILAEDIAAQYPVEFVVNETIAHPHATLYQPEYPQQNVEKIFTTVEKIAGQFSPISAFISRLQIAFPNGRGIWLQVEPSPEIRKLHETTVQALNPLREGYIRPYRGEFSALEEENIQKYGHPYVLKAYSPHISLTSFQNTQEARHVLEEFTWEPTSCVFEKIGVYTMGDHGTCKELLRSFDLHPAL